MISRLVILLLGSSITTYPDYDQVVHKTDARWIEHQIQDYLYQVEDKDLQLVVRMQKSIRIIEWCNRWCVG